MTLNRVILRAKMKRRRIYIRIVVTLAFVLCVWIKVFYKISPNMQRISHYENNQTEKLLTTFIKIRNVTSDENKRLATNGIKHLGTKEELPNVVMRPTMADDRHSPRTILMYKPVHWITDWIGQNGWDTSNIFKNCPVSNCVLSKNITKFNEVDLIIFRGIYGTTCWKKSKLGQIWMIMEHETPFSYGRFTECHRYKFNWTMTYRRDSDFTLVHGQFTHSSGYDERKLESIIKAKKNAIVGFMSNCKTPSKREDYVERLRSYGLHIDVYGHCGNHTCHMDGNKWKTVWNSTGRVKDKNNCFGVLDTPYKFYLSFENSLCTDYVTEKSMHLVLRHNIVPIIRDASNHTLFHPPKSYIHTNDFKDVTSLADRLKQLFVDTNEYKSYFDWRKYYSSQPITGVLQNEFCNICHRLQNSMKYQRVYNDIDNFLRRKDIETPICKSVTDI